MSWNRKLWGVLFTSGLDEPPRLIGQLWNSSEANYSGHADEPTRPLLFNTRVHARAWCQRMNARWRARGKDDCVSLWRVRPVRVRETVKAEE